MKKIFGVLSLIAILTVAFSTKAIASEADNVSTEYVASLDAPDFVAVAVVDLPTFTLFTNPMEVPITNSLANGEVVDSAEIVAGVLSNNESNYANIFLPVEVGLFTANVDNGTLDFTNTEPDLNKPVSSEYTNGYETPLLVSWISANVGKLTKTLDS